MKTTEKKLEFVRLRAEGHSYGYITGELGISKGTCTSWSRELREDIDAYKDENRRELFTAYRMTKEARIADLGQTLDAINTAIAGKDFSKMTTEKLLELKLKYEGELGKLYEELPREADPEGADTLEGLLEQYNSLYMDSKSGKLSPAQVKAQLSILEAKRATMDRISAGELLPFSSLQA